MFKTEMHVRVIEDKDRRMWGLAPADARYLVAAVNLHDGDYAPEYWKFVLIRSGVDLALWDETVSGREEEWYPQSVRLALEICQELHAAATQAGLPIDSSDPVIVRESVQRGIFFVDTNSPRVQWRKHAPPARKRRRLTQKRLDGGEDMTV